MRHEHEVSFHGDLAAAFNLAAMSLTSLGFRITQRSEALIEFVGAGMTSTKQSPLTGASGIIVRARGQSLRLEAELGGVQTMSRFVLGFPFVLGLVLVGVFYLVFGQGGDFVTAAIATAAAVGPWIVIGPLMARWIKLRTTRALDALLENMAMIGKTL